MSRNDELMHYGVLGMKWGQRRVRKNYEKAKSYSDRAAGARAGAKEGQDIARSNAKKGKSSNIVNRHIERAGGKKAYNYTKNQSTGKAVAKSMLMGTYGTTKYNKARSEGDSRVKAAAKGAAHETANRLTGGALSVVEPRVKRKKK